MNRHLQPEQSILSAIMLDSKTIDRLQLQPEHFAERSHQTIYKCMQDMNRDKKEIDLISLMSELYDHMDTIGGINYLTEISSMVTTTKHAEQHEQVVFKGYRNRKSQELTEKYNTNRNDKTALDLRISLEKLELVGIKDERTKTYDVYMEIANEIMEGENPLQSGYKTGLKDLDRMTGGLQRGNLTIIAGRPSMAKTALALNIAGKISEDEGIPHILTYEMSAKSLLKRMISTTGNMNGDVWLTNTFTAEDYHKAINAISILSEREFEVYEHTTKVREIKSIMRKAIEDKPDKKHILIVDGVNFLEAEGKHGKKTDEIEEVAQDLKMLATELNIPVVLISQLNRSVDNREDKRPFMSDLRDSGALEQLADVVIFLYRDEYYNPKSDAKGIAEIIISKQRNGATGTVEAAFIKDYGKFISLEHKR